MGFNPLDALGGIAAGAMTPFGVGALGSMPSVANKLPFVGSFVEDPAQERLRRQMARAGQLYEEYRPQARAAGVDATNQALQAFAPGNRALGDLYGERYMYDLGVQDPFRGGGPSGVSNASGTGLRNPTTPGEAQTQEQVRRAAQAAMGMFGKG